MEQISYNCPSDLLNKLNEETSKGSYSSRSEFITTAIRFYLEKRDRTFDLREELKVIPRVFRRGRTRCENSSEEFLRLFCRQFNHRHPAITG